MTVWSPTINLFRDPRWERLLAALESGAVEAVTRAECRDEYRIVLHYPHLPLDEASRAQAEERFDALVRVVDGAGDGDEERHGGPRLP